MPQAMRVDKGLTGAGNTRMGRHCFTWGMVLVYGGLLVVGGGAGGIACLLGVVSWRGRAETMLAWPQGRREVAGACRDES
jgi:hypothetical protein